MNKNCSKSDIVYNSNCNFYKDHRDSEKFYNLCLKLEHLFLAKFFDNLSKFEKLKTQKQKTEKQKKKQKQKKNVHNTASELYNDLLEIYFDQYNDLNT